MRRRNESGAALLIAIGIMVILLAIALTFFAVSRLELNTATNVTNTVRADNIADAANSIAIHALNNEFARHPNVTSTDHAWRTYFNGAAFVGKYWALRGGVMLQAGGVPLVDLSKLDGASPVYVRFADNYVEPLYRGARTLDWLYIPRFEGNAPVYYDSVTFEDAGGAPMSLTAAAFNTLNNPFVTSPYYGAPAVNGSRIFGAPINEDDGLQYPTEQIDAWTDVDNDGDGLRDSLWLPIPADVFFPDDGLDNNLNGLTDERQDNTFGQGGDEDGDGYIGTYRESDGVSTRLDSTVAAHIDLVPNADFDPDEAIEGGTFIYNGLGPMVDLGDGTLQRLGDGLDNDGNGQVDEPEENRLFLTAPLPGISMLVDLNDDGVPGDLVPDANGNPVPLRVQLPAQITVTVANTYTDNGGTGGTRTLGAADVDKLDNDYDLFVNNYNTYAYVGPNTHNTGAYPPFRLRGYTYKGEALDNTSGTILRVWSPLLDSTAVNSKLLDGDQTYINTWVLPGNWAAGDISLYSLPRSRTYKDINLQSCFGRTGGVTPGLTFIPSTGAYHVQTETGTYEEVTVDYAALMGASIRITHSGEPVCELAGRMAILITDEASKVNLNATGGHHYNEGSDSIARALGKGASTYEYDTRVLPANPTLGTVESAQLWSLLNGSPDGTNPDGTNVKANTPIPYAADPYAYDKRLPGYGRVDDNANLFELAFNGRDDDGDGLIDEGFRIPQPGDPDYSPEMVVAYTAQLGLFEGIDEPQELQRSAPLRNEVAEVQYNEIGKYGDRQLNDIDQVKQVNGLGDTIYGYLRNLTTMHSSDRNAAYVLDAFGNNRAVNRLDINHATAAQIATQLVTYGNFLPATRELSASSLLAREFAEGLRQNGLHLSSPTWTEDNSTYGGFLFADYALNADKLTAFPADPFLDALQTAVDIVDDRDTDHGRTALSTDKIDSIASNNGYNIPWPTTLNDREAIPDAQLFPVEEIDQSILSTLGKEKNLSAIDTWWEDMVKTDNPDVDVTDRMRENTQPEQRLITNTVSGNEAIKINELMVRPVRRVEAEAITHEVSGTSRIPLSTYYDVDTGLYTPTSALLASYLNYYPSPWRGMPEFDLYTRATAYDEGWFRFPDATTYPGSAIDEYLGHKSGFQSRVDTANSPATLNTDIIQFVFTATDGLPAGRYFLTMNTTDENGDPTVYAPNQMQYAIKYVQIDPTTNSPIANSTVLEDNAAIPDQVEARLLIDYPSDSAARDAARASYLAAANLADWANVSMDEIAHGPGEAPGWVFLDGTPKNTIFPNNGLNALNNLAFQPGAGYYTDGGLEAGMAPTSGYPTHTVTIPSASSGYALCVAVRVSPNQINPNQYLAVNFFDFTQEPDHEWVELTNVSNEAVNVGGWQLEIGIPNPPNKPETNTDPFKSQWTIPEGTVVGPNDYLLLSFESGAETDTTGNVTKGVSKSKFDHFQDDPMADTPGDYEPGSQGIPTKFTPNMLNVDGIGLERGTTGGIYTDFGNISNVTVPPIADESSTNDALYTDNSGMLGDPTGSVFERNYTAALSAWYTDYVDSNGDGVSSAHLDLADAVNYANDRRTDNAALENGAIDSTPYDLPKLKENATIELPGKPFDRIVSLINNELWRKDPRDPNSDRVTLYDSEFNPAANPTNPEVPVGKLARIVLQGGFLPDYPEHDGIDNDGDGAYLKWSTDTPSLPTYVPGTLDKDGVDNNLNGIIDERGDGLDVFGDGVYVLTDGDIPPNPFNSEGVDEGQNVGAGNYSLTPLPVAFLNNRHQDDDGNGYLTGVYPTDHQWMNGNSATYPFWYIYPDPSTVVDLMSLVPPSEWTSSTVATWSATGSGFTFADVPDGFYVSAPVPALQAEAHYVVSYNASGSVDTEIRIYVGDDTPSDFSNCARFSIASPTAAVIGVVEVVCKIKAYPLLKVMAANNSGLASVDLTFSVKRVDDFVKGINAAHGTTTNTVENDFQPSFVTRLGQRDAVPAMIWQHPGWARWLGTDVTDTTSITGLAPYLGTANDPPDWKAFVERRWYPGDNVIVTLYAGKAETGKVADRVTYREEDITNRTIDDILPCPYFTDGYDQQTGTSTGSTNNAGEPAEVPSLNPGVYNTWWQPNQMGLDFYRSLERKDPLYHGDRFGTSNRWEATDGNYDDWAESMSVASLTVVAVNNGQTFLENLRNTAVAAVRTENRFIAEGEDNFQRDVARLLGHSFYASPLRMNYATRLRSNPPDLVRLLGNGADVASGTTITRPTSQFFYAPNAYTPGDLIQPADSSDSSVAVANLDWAARHEGMNEWMIGTERYHEPAAGSVIRDRSFDSVADLARLPHFVFGHRMLNVAAVTGFQPSLAEYTFLYDSAHENINFFEKAFANLSPDERLLGPADGALRGAVLGQDRTYAADVANILDTAADLSATNPIVLSVGQADFTPIRPNPDDNLLAAISVTNGSSPHPDAVLTYPSSQTLKNVMNWYAPDGTNAVAPAAWMPVFAFSLDGDASVAGKRANQFPYYPPYPGGYNVFTARNESTPLNYLLNAEFMQNGGGMIFSGALGQADLASRWPLEKRVLMYVSENRSGINTQHRPEAVFAWDGADGLENGEYYAYVGTFMPDLNKRINLADDATDTSKKLLAPDAGVSGNYFEPAVLLALDPTLPGAENQARKFKPRLQLEVITDRTRAQGQAAQSAGGDAAGLTYPTDWNPYDPGNTSNPSVEYQPDGDGFIAYGATAQTNWQPQVVRVTDRFLALRVRNVGDPSEVGVLTQVILAPRKRTPGKININTAENRILRRDKTSAGVTTYYQQFFNPLLGLPGVVDVLNTLVVPGSTPAQVMADPLSGADDLTLRTADVASATAPWASPSAMVNAAAMPPLANDGNTDLLATAADSGALAAARLSALMMNGRKEHADGRYYDSIADLVRDALGKADAGNTGAIYPLSNDANGQRRFDEAVERLSRMANLITMRSDVFEIIATVQAGYGIDYNNDGWINYRSPEFVTTAESKGRLIYERRTPATQAGQAVKNKK